VPRRLALASGLFLAGMAGFVYGIANPAVGEGSDVAAAAILSSLAALHLTTGAVAGSLWALLLPIGAPVLALPAGYPNTSIGEPLPIWFGLAVFIEPFGILAVAVGVIAAKAITRRRARRPSG
jgi:hypothetical protein